MKCNNESEMKEVSINEVKKRLIKVSKMVDLYGKIGYNNLNEKQLMEFYIYVLRSANLSNIYHKMTFNSYYKFGFKRKDLN